MLKYKVKYTFMGEVMERTATSLFELGLLIEQLENNEQVPNHSVHINTLDESVAPKPLSKKRPERFPAFRKTSLSK